jgi:hypothetical protein
LAVGSRLEDVARERVLEVAMVRALHGLAVLDDQRDLLDVADVGERVVVVTA